jgi:hypothetical protein
MRVSGERAAATLLRYAASGTPQALQKRAPGIETSAPHPRQAPGRKWPHPEQ